MTRCISCTRCVRFITEVAGVPEMGQTGRGEDSEITSYLGRMLTSEMQGNVIDLCPVGALTSKPYSFTARPWELSKFESIDVTDALGTNVRVDVKGREVMRILPRNHDGVNEEWIADRSRFLWDGLRRQRLDRPYVRVDGKLRPATWAEAFAAVAAGFKGRKVAALAGDLAPTEAVFALKGLADALGWATECRTDGAQLPIGDRAGYAGTARIADIDSAKHVVIVGANPRHDAPVLNARVRKAWLNGASVSLIGAPVDLTYPYAHLGADRAALAALAGGDVGAMAEEPSVVIVGADALTGADGAAVLAAAGDFAARTNSGLLILHVAASRVGAMDLGFATEGGMAAALDGAEAVYALGVDEIDLPAGAFVVYQGSHGDRGAHRADVILPGAAYTEESGVFVNLEGRPQMSNRAGFPPGEARENWAILRALSATLGATLPYDSLGALRARMIEAAPHLARIDQVAQNEWRGVAAGALGSGPFGGPAREHYLGNPIARASETMAELARLARTRVTAMAAE
jgi:NADH-quinone oxidoreductase subunit G